MRHIESYIERNRERMGLADGRIFVELHAPSSPSRLHRIHYRVRVGSDQNYSLFVQNDRSVMGHRCPSSPYEPAFADLVRPFLALRHGAFEDGRSRFYWSEYLRSPCLLESLRWDTRESKWQDVESFSDQILELQRRSARTAGAASVLGPLCKLIAEKIDKPDLVRRWQAQSAPVRQLFSPVQENVVSWSHGDLWPMEVFREGGRYIVVDWEWSLAEAPIGADIIDFYLNTAQHCLGANFQTSWNGLLANGFKELSGLRELLHSHVLQAGCSGEMMVGTLLYCLLRWWGREVAQEGAAALTDGRSQERLHLTRRITMQTAEIFGALGSRACEVGGRKTPDVPILSVIIPTFNRSRYLRGAIESIAAQTTDRRYFEIIVVDNGSTDDTRDVVSSILPGVGSDRVRYFYEPVPGLLSGRHRGAKEARGDYLCFVDDDIIASEGWLNAIIESFAAPGVHLVGGPSLPLFESDPPPWIRAYVRSNGGHLTCGHLSLIDLGEEAGEIDPVYVWGLNYSIRKSTLLELGGFHPDNIPQRLQCFQGDGETGLSLKLKSRGYKAFYHPGAKVYHRIPPDRFTQAYFEKRQFYQGVCDSFTHIRHAGGAAAVAFRRYEPGNGIDSQDEYRDLHEAVHKAYVEGYNFHLSAVKREPGLLNWVLRSDYLDYRLPYQPVN